MRKKKEAIEPELELFNSVLGDLTVCQLRELINRELKKNPTDVNTDYIDACFGLIKAKEAFYNKLPDEFSYVDLKRNLIQTALVAAVVVLRLMLMV